MSGTLLARFRRDASGASALEFAIIAPIFFALVLSTLEAGWMMTKATLLDRAVDVTMREVRLGGKDAPASQSAIRAAVCKRALVLHDCETNTTVELLEVKTAADFPTANATCVNRDGNMNPVVAYKPAQRSMIMYVRICVVTNTLTPFIGMALQLPKDSRGGYRLVASTAFMNEPGA